MLNDFNSGGGSTAGGNCLPGDRGWIIEVEERSTQTWTQARMTCLRSGMRLPEIFEFQFSCDNRALFGLLAMTGNWEWSSNRTHIPGNGLGAAVTGNANCNSMSWGWVGNSNNGADSRNFRCAL